MSYVVEIYEECGRSTGRWWVSNEAVEDILKAIKEKPKGERLLGKPIVRDKDTTDEAG